MISTPSLIEVQHWPYPTPLQQTYDASLPYPIACLPNIIQDAVISYQTYGKQPLSLIACSALANVSLACQAQANVARDRVLISPISLYFISVSPSGSRKSSIDSAFGQTIKNWEKRTSEELEPEVKDARVLHQAWLSEKEAILTQIRRTASMGRDTAHLKHQLQTVMSNGIFTFFLTREFSFGGSVFCTEHMDTYQRGLVFLAGSCASGMAHKLLAMEVTKEILKITSDVPNYSRDNIANVAQKIAYGKYRHHSLHVPIKDPKNLLHLGINFFSATCGWNMGLFRLTYLIAFSNLLSFVKTKLEKNASKPYSSARFFDLAMPVAGLSDASNRDITHSNKPH